MEKNEDVYIKLQRHLDSQAVGFPATRSGSELGKMKMAGKLYLDAIRTGQTNLLKY